MCFTSPIHFFFLSIGFSIRCVHFFTIHFFHPYWVSTIYNTNADNYILCGDDTIAIHFTKIHPQHFRLFLLVCIRKQKPNWNYMAARKKLKDRNGSRIQKKAMVYVNSFSSVSFISLIHIDYQNYQPNCLNSHFFLFFFFFSTKNKRKETKFKGKFDETKSYYDQTLVYSMPFCRWDTFNKVKVE